MLNTMNLYYTKVIAFYIPNFYSKNAITIYQHYNSVKDIFNINNNKNLK